MAKELGEILVEQGTLSDEQLKRAELYARQNNVSVGDALVSFGFATEEQVTAARAKHHSLPYASKLYIDEILPLNYYIFVSTYMLRNSKNERFLQQDYEVIVVGGGVGCQKGVDTKFPCAFIVSGG